MEKTWDTDREGPAVWIDGGDSAVFATPQETDVSRLIFETMAKMGYVAVTLGAHDLSNEPGSFSSVIETVPLPWISANLRFHDTGERVFPAYRIVTIPATRRSGAGRPLRLGIVGYTWPWDGLIVFGPEGRSLIGTDPLEEIRSLLPEVRSKSDLVVLTTTEDEHGSESLLRSLTGIDLALVGTSFRTWSGARAIGGATTIHAGDRGREVVRVAVRRSGGGYDLDVSKLQLAKDTVEEDPATAALVEEAVTRFNEQSRVLMTAYAASNPPPSTEPFVGPLKCLECHAREFEVWSGTRHAEAFAPLVEAKRDYTQVCVYCHVTGWHREEGGGFVDPASTPQMLGVQCEACHGPGRAHLDDPSAPYGTMEVPAGCEGCHDPENSSEFDYATYWPQIAH